MNKEINVPRHEVEINLNGVSRVNRLSRYYHKYLALPCVTLCTCEVITFSVWSSAYTTHIDWQDNSMVAYEGVLRREQSWLDLDFD